MTKEARNEWTDIQKLNKINVVVKSIEGGWLDSRRKEVKTFSRGVDAL